MDPKPSTDAAAGLSRRRFLQSSTAAGAGLALGPVVLGEEAKSAARTMNVALLGAGVQGRLLMVHATKIPNVRVRAVCDIWPYSRTYATRLLAAHGHEVPGFEDYRDLLAQTKDLDAAIVATPDWVHAEQAVACLKAGLHVYCESAMAHTSAAAREMVLAARAAGRLLQIGHQRRSNPRYLAALDYVRAKKACGQVTFVQGQWNRAKRPEVGYPKAHELDAAVLQKYGYGTMQRLRNWRWYKDYSAGPMADLGAHQVDVFNWFLGVPPRAVMASGGLDYDQGIDWFDSLSALVEWNAAGDAAAGTVRGFYQTLTTTSHGGCAETFMGTEGSLTISETAEVGGLRRELEAPEPPWEKELQAAVAKAAGQPEKKEGVQEDEAGMIPIGPSIRSPARYYPPIAAAGADKPDHLAHLENFVDAVARGTPLACPGETAYAALATAVRINEAVGAGRRLALGPEDVQV